MDDSELMAMATHVCNEMGVPADAEHWNPLVEALREVARRAQPEEGWVSVEERLPRPGVPVLAFFRYAATGKGRRIRAYYAATNTLELKENEWSDGCTVDEHGTEYVPPGWYETNEMEEVHWLVAERVTHWRPLPPGPEE